MPAPERRLAIFLAGLVLVLSGLELGLRALAPRLEDAVHRARFKAAVLAEHPPHELVTLGSSRFEEGFLPGVFAREAGRRGLGWTAFNAAVANSSVEMLGFMCQRVAARPGVRLVLIELSESQLEHHALEWESRALPASADGRAFAWLGDHFALVRLRQAFMLDNVARLGAALFLARRFDGSEHYGTDYALALAGRSLPTTDGIPAAAWRYDLVTPGTAVEPAGADVAAFKACAARLQAGGATVAFVVLPTRYSPDALERKPPFKQLLAELTAASGAPAFDFSVAPTPGEAYRDWIHLNAMGAARFSEVLTSALFERGLLVSGAVQ